MSDFSSMRLFLSVAGSVSWDIEADFAMEALTDFKPDLSWVIVIMAFFVVVVVEQSMRVEQDLINDENDGVSSEDHEFGKWEDLLVGDA
jgi:hypothetical protein